MLVALAAEWPAASSQRLRQRWTPRCDGDTQPQTQRTLTPAGETEVNYYTVGR